MEKKITKSKLITLYLYLCIGLLTINNIKRIDTLGTRYMSTSNKNKNNK